MKIIIEDKHSLDAFVKRVAPQTSMPASRLKTAIAKGFGYNHVQALEAALVAKTTLSLEISNLDCEQESLSWAGVDSQDELNVEHFEQSEDAVMHVARDIEQDPALIQAVRLLQERGLSSIGDKLADLAKASRVSHWIGDIV